MAYSEKVMDHFNHPRNVGEMENPSGVGTVGNAKCGDIMRMYLDIDDNGIIQEAKFKTFGCGAAVATSSMATELVKGKTIQEALEVTNNDNNNNIAGEEDKAVLLKLVQSQASLDGAQYTQLSWYLLQIRLGDAQEVLESAESTKKDVSCAQEKLQAAINALQKNDTSTNVYEDGTYDVSTLCIPDDDMDFSAYNLSMKVTIANDRIVSITDVKGDGDSQNVSYIKKAVDGTKNQAGMVSVLTSQTNADSIDFSSIDTVSHATCTSKAIIDGCKSALEAAKKK